MLAKAQYAETFAARKVLRGRYFALHYCANAQLSARLGLVIPKKQARSAVLRNAVKRQVRELFRHRRDTLPCVDMVLRLANAPGCSGNAGITRELRAGWRTELMTLFEKLRQCLPGR